MNVSSNAPVMPVPLEEQEPIAAVTENVNPTDYEVPESLSESGCPQPTIRRSTCETRPPSHLSEYHCKMATCALSSPEFSSCQVSTSIL